MELRHLRYFVTVAAERSFSRASDKLNIAQPPLSRQIQQLEAELGVQLLHRGRPLTLTESGRYFFEQARQVLQRTDAIPAMIRRIGTGKRRQFGIGFVESTLNEQLPELIRRFRLTAPDVEIVLLDLTTLEQTSALKGAHRHWLWAIAIQRRWDHPPRHPRGEAIGCHPARPCPKPQERSTQAEAYRWRASHSLPKRAASKLC